MGPVVTVWKLLPLLLLLAWTPSSNGDCLVKVQDQMPSPEPLLLRPGGSLDIRGFWTPDADGFLRLSAGRKVVVACIGSKINGVGREQATFTCDSGTTFSIGDQSYDFKTLKCDFNPRTSSRSTGKKCGTADEHDEVQLGFQVGSDFYALVTACFDSDLKRTLYSKGEILSTIGGAERLSFKGKWQNDFFGFDAQKLYNPAKQLTTMTTLLGSEEQAKKYVDTDQKLEKFLTKGHLVPKGTMNLAAMGYATFFLVNAGPQWAKVNGGNWRKMEDSVEKYVKDNLVDLNVYTGSYGVTTLPNTNDEQVDLYLHLTSPKNQIPLPKFFWKLVYNPRTKAAIVFITINNPYIIKPGKDYFVCTDVCSQINWIRWTPKRRQEGFSYCCEYSDFKQSVREVPDIEVDSILN